MNVTVLGLWHLGSVTAACAAAAGHEVAAWDPDAGVLASLRQSRPPVDEPGLADLVRQQVTDGRLRFDVALEHAAAHGDVVWIAFDTPVDDEDRADVDSVVRHIEAALPFVKDDAVILVSSQVPVGTARRLEAICAASRPSSNITFACSPENLRLGKAIEVFTAPDRVILGCRTAAARARLAALFAPITDRLEWMSVESAEMTKHAINSFLATSVAFINEIASVAARVGADAREVERGLKTERRIGPAAYLSPGGAFAGGTLARDVTFVRHIGDQIGVQTPLLDGVLESNIVHRGWARARLERELKHVRGRRVAVWGLTYKPGTDTLRRSEAVVLCRWLVAQGAEVVVHDPAARDLPDDLAGQLTRTSQPLDAARDAEALVIATEWPEYRQVEVDGLATAMPSGLIIDANRFLWKHLGTDARFRLVSVGQPE